MRARAPAFAVAVAGAALLACFSDGGLHQPVDTAATTGTTSSSSSGSSTTTSTTGTTADPTEAITTTGTTAPLPVCGDGVIDTLSEECDDGNLDDTDDCRNTCELAECGDGVVWAGVEECDLGAGNHPTLPGACRPTCKNPACGDGAFYFAPALAPIVIDSPSPAIVSDDAPRSLGVAADGTFFTAWRVDKLPDNLFVQKIGADGTLLELVDLMPNTFIDSRDLALAVAPNGDHAVVWEELTDPPRIRTRGVQAGEATGAFVVPGVNATINAPAIALAADGALVASYLITSLGNDHVYLRRFPSFTANDAPAQLKVSEHDAGDASSSTIAMTPTGDFVVAWGDPTEAIFYRRYTVDLQPGPIIDTGLKVGRGEINNAEPWTAVTVRPNDGAVVIVGVDPAGHLTLSRFDAADVAAASVQVADVDARYVPNVDVASDATGNLAVAWSGCGVPGDGADDCGNLPSTSSIRWFHGSDLAPHDAAVQLVTKDSGQPSPVSLAVAPNGATAASYVAGNTVVVHMFPVQCP